jgi:hypothetical protein
MVLLSAVLQPITLLSKSFIAAHFLLPLEAAAVVAYPLRGKYAFGCRKRHA